MIKLFCGSMYSGKSESLIRDLIKCTYAKKKILFIRPYMDDRGYITHSRNDSKVIKAINEKKIEFDVVVDFSLKDHNKFKKGMIEALEKEFPGFVVDFNIDLDYSS